MTTFNISLRHFLVGLFFLLGITVHEPLYSDESKISERTHKRLRVIHRLMSENKYVEALSRLDSLSSHVSKRKYDNAYVQQTYGYLYSSMNKVDAAISSFNKSLSTGGLSNSLSNNIKINIVQLYNYKEDNLSAAIYFKQWLSSENNPSASGLALGGMVYSALNNSDLAVKYLMRAINNSKKPQESWYQTLVSVYFDDKNYKLALNLLKKLLEINPLKKSYWVQLSSVYQNIDKQDMALSTYRLAYLNKLFTEEVELMHLARLYMAEDLPFSAASIIKESINNKIISPSVNNMNLLYQAYVESNELDLAIKSLTISYGISGDINTKVEIAQLFMGLDKWSDAKKILDEVLKVSAIEDDSNAYFLAGITNYELKNYSEALRLFKISATNSTQRLDSEQWIAYIKELII